MAGVGQRQQVAADDLLGALAEIAGHGSAEGIALGGDEAAQDADGLKSFADRPAFPVEMGDPDALDLLGDGVGRFAEEVHRGHRTMKRNISWVRFAAAFMPFDPLFPPPLLAAALPAIGGRIKAIPEDFEGGEIPAYQPGGQGAFLYLGVEKESLGREYFVAKSALRP